MKLNIKPPIPAEKRKPLLTEWSKANPPVGYWKVTTEGDCEGRSTKNLGEFYGHVANIAFYLADKVFYSLKFIPVESPRLNTPQINNVTAARKKVWISLDINSGTWDLNGKNRVNWFTDWLDVEDVEVCERDTNAVYFASVLLKLRPVPPKPTTSV